MNIIFLDVDGVLNSILKDKDHYGDKRPYTDYTYPFNDDCLCNLSLLVKETNSFIVITSTWKNDKLGKQILLANLRRYNLDNRVVGYTNNLNKSKLEEIKDYLEILDENINYIIIDDENDFDELKEHLIKTDYELGLTKEIVDEAKKY